MKDVSEIIRISLITTLYQKYELIRVNCDDFYYILKNINTKLC